MINAEKARADSDRNFKINNAQKIEFISDFISTVVRDGFRSVWIESSSCWVSKSSEETMRLIEHIKEHGFKVSIMCDRGMTHSKWGNTSKGIEVSW